MSNTLLHSFVSAVPDLGVAGELSPADWNFEHIFGGGANGAFLVRDSTQTDGANWSTAYTSPIAIGGATSTLYQLRLLGTFAPSASAGAAFAIGSSLTLAVAADAYGLLLAPTFTEAASGVHALLAGLHVALTITNAAATVTTVAAISIPTFAAGAGTTNAVGLYLSAAPTGGTNNFTLWSVAGTNRLQGYSRIGGASGIDVNDSATFTDGIVGRGAGSGLALYAGAAQKVTLDNSGVLKIGGTALRVTTEGTNRLDIFDATAPVGTLAAGISLYSTAGELRVMDSGGTATLLSPHDRQTGEWIFLSKNTRTGQVLRIDTERLLRALDGQLGGGYVHEYVERN